VVTEAATFADEDGSGASAVHAARPRHAGTRAAAAVRHQSGVTPSVRVLIGRVWHGTGLKPPRAQLAAGSKT
jgi:hypothetical protein